MPFKHSKRAPHTPPLQVVQPLFLFLTEQVYELGQARRQVRTIRGPGVVVVFFFGGGGATHGSAGSALV